MRITKMVVGIGAVLLAGCQHQPAPVAVPAIPESIGPLAGSWEGTYVGSDARKTGKITLAMRVAGDSAVGEMLMEQPAGRRALKPDDEPSFHLRHASSPTMLAVKFQPAASGDLSGALEPFIQPDCECTATTVFSVRVRGDTLRGTFETRGQTLVQRGTWWASRKAVIVTESPAPPTKR